MSGWSRSEARAYVPGMGVLTNYQRIRYAIKGVGTDLPMLRQTLSTMSKEEIEAADAQWRRPTTAVRSLVAAVRGDTSGRDESDLADLVEHGAPTDCRGAGRRPPPLRAIDREDDRPGLLWVVNPTLAATTGKSIGAQLTGARSRPPAAKSNRPRPTSPRCSAPGSPGTSNAARARTSTSRSPTPSRRSNSSATQSTPGPPAVDGRGDPRRRRRRHRARPVHGGRFRCRRGCGDHFTGRHRRLDGDEGAGERRCVWFSEEVMTDLGGRCGRRDGVRVDGRPGACAPRWRRPRRATVGSRGGRPRAQPGSAGPAPPAAVGLASADSSPASARADHSLVPSRAAGVCSPPWPPRAARCTSDWPPAAPRT